MELSIFLAGSRSLTNNSSFGRTVDRARRLPTVPSSLGSPAAAQRERRLDQSLSAEFAHETRKLLHSLICTPIHADKV